MTKSSAEPKVKRWWQRLVAGVSSQQRLALAVPQLDVR